MQSYSYEYLSGLSHGGLLVVVGSLADDAAGVAAAAVGHGWDL